MLYNTSNFLFYSLFLGRPHLFNTFSYDMILIMGLSLVHLNSKILLTDFLASQETLEIMKGIIPTSQWKWRSPFQRSEDICSRPSYQNADPGTGSLPFLIHHIKA